ncbi:MAG TPA: glycosyltransferase family 2 protein [Gemmatimonadaceae bacterium]|nr:glycosyltransferase family 2 protein [Gemmatimonadaceae bacterium]
MARPTPTAVRRGFALDSYMPQATVELSVVMPCLNEADTLATCIGKAQRALAAAGISGEVIVADNGSTDGSIEIAERAGARVVHVHAKGYGSALMGGIESAHGRYILMGDADDSYDFGELPKFVAKLREGYDLVQGCRLPAGGGAVSNGAMPFLHRWWGNPMFSWMVRRWFRAPIHDVHCGMRAFTKELYTRLDQRCTGMEFASEQVIKASIHGAKIAEVPITLHKDGRTSHPPHLKTFRDGWRHFRCYLMFSPRWLFLLPGMLLGLCGIAGYALAMPQTRIGNVTFDVNTLLFASLAIVCGYQSVLFALLTKFFAIGEGLLPTDARIERIGRILTLERGLILGALTAAAGVGMLVATILQWRAHGFGPMNYATSLRLSIPGMTLTVLGFQTFLWSFFVSVLALKRR